VQDPAGAVVVSAEVGLKRISTNGAFGRATTSTGDYVLSNRPIDRYDLEVASAGFRTEARRGITLEVGQTYRFDIQLSVGESTQFISVEAAAPVLKTDTAEFGQVIDNKKIIDLPLNSRDVIYS